MDRRTFLKLAGMGSLAFATACTAEREKRLYSLVKSPEDMEPGTPRWYASTCRECPAGCGVLVKNREGRAIKIEGNPLHPVSRGTLCMRGQAALQAVYNPDRLQSPQIRENGKWHSIDYARAQQILNEKVGTAAAAGENRVRMITAIEGDSLLNLFESTLSAVNAEKPLVYEPIAYENLKAANAVVFGESGLPAYRIDEADCLVGFGADFVETWLSPVEYARRFKAMHRYGNGRKNRFYHVAPSRSLTGANADAWLQCRPGGEAAVCLGLIRALLVQRKAAGLDKSQVRVLTRIAEPYMPEKVKAVSGVSVDRFTRLIRDLLQAEKPLVLGTDALANSGNDLSANIAVNLLNVLLDPSLSMLDFSSRHRIEQAEGRQALLDFAARLDGDGADVLLLHNVNPLYDLPPGSPFAAALNRKNRFVVSFSNFMDDTAQAADMVFPVSLPLESWGEYGGRRELLSTLQPAMLPLFDAPHIGDVMIRMAGNKGKPAKNVKQHLIGQLEARWQVADQRRWLETLRNGGRFESARPGGRSKTYNIQPGFEKYFEDEKYFKDMDVPEGGQSAFIALPSIRFYDGRGANRPWLCEIPDPVTKVAWQTMLLVNPETAAQYGVSHGDVATVENADGIGVSAAVFETDNLVPGVFAMQLGQGHTAYGRYAAGRGVNPCRLFSTRTDPVSDTGAGAFRYAAAPVSVTAAGKKKTIAHTDGSDDQHGRKIALTVSAAEMQGPPPREKPGLTMHDFPLTLPLPEGYDRKRDFYPPHDHKDYRWAMVVDLDRCIGCNACAAACYAENNIGVVGEDELINGREMSWMHIERYRRIDNADELIFLPMLCQHCDNAPCESVCPVFAPHHNKEGLNNQIYNRCIGTRFCAQNCPYKVRKFNWFEWQWPEPLDLQLNPDVTVRTKGVMEKCSFCIQRIKAAHNTAKNEGRMIKDGEVTPACVQTCPTGALVFGSLLDETSRVSKLVKDRRAYQVMGYLNTKPAVIYLKKVVTVV